MCTSWRPPPIAGPIANPAEVESCSKPCTEKTRWIEILHYKLMEKATAWAYVREF